MLFLNVYNTEKLKFKIHKEEKGIRGLNGNGKKYNKD